MPLDFSGSRHYGGPSVPTTWLCPTCHTKQTSRFEDGCPSCGAGTQAMLAAAQRQAPPPVNVAPLVLGEMIKGMADKTVVAFVQLKPYTLEARETVAAALAFAAEQGMATEAGRLAPHEMLAWARAIIGSEETE